MSESALNAYRSPTVISTDVPDAANEAPDPAMIKMFGQQSLALGALWIIVGSLSLTRLGLGTYLIYTEGASPEVVARVVGAVSLNMIFWAASIGIGVLALRKNMWAIAVGLFFTYVHIFFSGGILGLVLHVIVILQAHRVLRWGKKMRAAGIPFDAKD